MRTELTIAGAACVILALGHSTVGLRWVLPQLTRERLERTPFGGPTNTIVMIRFSWHVVTLNLLGFSVLLLTLAADPDVDLRTLLLRWFGAVWLIATGMVLWNARREPRGLVRLPVPIAFVLVAVMCLLASS